MTVTKNRRHILTITALAAAVAIVLILALTALNRGTGTGTAAGAVDGTSVNKIEITSTEGESLTVPGERPTVLYFMASWCYTCIPQAQAMKELEGQYANDAQFIAVDVTPGNTKTQIDGFRELAGFPEHPYVVDETGELSKKYEVVSLDTTVVLAPDGEVLARADGQPMKADALQKFLDEALP